MVLRLDQSEWILISDRIYAKTDPWEEFPIVLPYPCDRAIVSVNVTARPSWVQSGGVTQRWQRLIIPIEVAYSSLKLSTPKVIKLEPVENSTLWFWSHHWITELNISVEVRRYQE